MTDINPVESKPIEQPEPDAPDPSLNAEELQVTYPPEGDVPEVDDNPDEDSK